MPSAREIQAARERREWVARDEQRQRDMEVRSEYEKYAAATNRKHLEPLAFDEWRKLLPETDDPATGGLLATNRAMWIQLAKQKNERLANAKLDNDELAELGFDLRHRPIYEMELSESVIIDMFRKFCAREPRFHAETQLSPVGEFLWRNRLTLSLPHISLAWELFLNSGLIQPKPEPAPEPERPEGLNEYGVNLQIEHDPVVEAQKRRKKYETEIVVTDPETGKGYTAYQLDHSPEIDSETYRRLMKIPRIFKNPAREPRH